MPYPYIGEWWLRAYYGYGGGWRQVHLGDVSAASARLAAEELMASGRLPTPTDTPDWTGPNLAAPDDGYRYLYKFVEYGTRTAKPCPKCPYGLDVWGIIHPPSASDTTDEEFEEGPKPSVVLEGTWCVGKNAGILNRDSPGWRLNNGAYQEAEEGRRFSVDLYRLTNPDGPEDEPDNWEFVETLRLYVPDHGPVPTATPFVDFTLTTSAEGFPQIAEPLFPRDLEAEEACELQHLVGTGELPPLSDGTVVWQRDALGALRWELYPVNGPGAPDVFAVSPGGVRCDCFRWVGRGLGPFGPWGSVLSIRTEWSVLGAPSWDFGGCEPPDEDDPEQGQPVDYKPYLLMLAIVLAVIMAYLLILRLLLALVELVAPIRAGLASAQAANVLAQSEARIAQAQAVEARAAQSALQEAKAIEDSTWQAYEAAYNADQAGNTALANTMRQEAFQSWQRAAEAAQRAEYEVLRVPH